MLDTRPIPQRSHAVHSRARGAGTGRAVGAPTPLRARMGAGGSAPTAPSPSTTISRTPSRFLSHAESGDYLPAYAYGIDGDEGKSRNPYRSFRPPSPAAALRAATLSARAVIYSPDGRRLRMLRSPKRSPPSGESASPETVHAPAPVRKPAAACQDATATQQPMSSIDAKTAHLGKTPRSPRSPRSPRDKQAGTHSTRLSQRPSSLHPYP